MRSEKWNEILDGKTLPFYDQPFESIWYRWAQGLANVSTGNAEAARNSLSMMDEAMQFLGRFGKGNRLFSHRAQ